jgi:hypothetical protein
MKKLELNELPKWSIWPERLLGLESFPIQNRTINKIEEEYNKDKFNKCLNLYHEHKGNTDPFELRFSIAKDNLNKEMSAVLDGELILATQNELLDHFFGILGDAIEPLLDKSNTVVELGTAFGTNLWMLSKKFEDVMYLGGDYSDNAVELASLLYEKKPNISVSKLNFYDKIYPVLEKTEDPVIIFTSQAIEQLPSCKCVLDALSKYKDKIHSVIHIEPAFELHDDSLMGLMCRRYIDINDYCKDLISQLESHSDVIKIDNIKKDIIGFVPFNSLSLVQWSFK